MNYVCVSLHTAVATRSFVWPFFFIKVDFFPPQCRQSNSELHRLPKHAAVRSIQAYRLICIRFSQPVRPALSAVVTRSRRSRYHPPLNVPYFLILPSHASTDLPVAAAGLPFTLGLIGFRLGGCSAFTSCAAAVRDASTTVRVCQIKALFIRGGTSDLKDSGLEAASFFSPPFSL